MSNRLIFGRNSIERITSCEISDGCVTLFGEDEVGNPFSVIKPNFHWILSPIQLDPAFEKLDGKLYYQWIKLYEDRASFMADRYKYNKRDVYFVRDAKEASMLINGFTYFKGMKVQDVSVLSWDIETSGLNHTLDAKVFIISNTFRNKQGKHRKLFSLDEYPDQASMLNAWCDWVREINPSLVIGHNIFGYDFLFIQHVAEISGTELRLGRDGSSLKIDDFDSEIRKEGSQKYKFKRSFIFGREIVDTMFVAFKYDVATKKYVSFALKQIIKQEGLEVANRQFYDAGTIAANWDNEVERVKIKAYAEHDADDALALFDLMIPSYFYWNQAIPKSCQSINYSATGSQINSFLTRSYIQEFHSITKASDAEKYEGAISFGIPGIYKNVFKVDVASLYPSVMLQYEVYDRYKDPKGNFLQMVKYFTEERLKNKKLGKETGDRYYKDLEQSQKIGINSAYGMLGAQGLNFNSPKNAAFVTAEGRRILEAAIEWASGQTVEHWTSKGSTEGDEVEE